MKRYLAMILSFIIVAMASGCATIYTTAVDERSVKTIASDTKIKAKIIKRFIEDDTIKTLDIFTACYDGDVYLVGEYETERQKKQAIEIAEKIEGVKTVVTYLLSKKKGGPCGKKENLTITAKVKGKLITDKNIWSTNIDIKTVQCNVVLIGLVGSKEEVRKAVAHARSVKGVRNVKSFLKSAN